MCAREKARCARRRTRALATGGETAISLFVFSPPKTECVYSNKLCTYGYVVSYVYVKLTPVCVTCFRIFSLCVPFLSLREIQSIYRQKDFYVQYTIGNDDVHIHTSYSWPCVGLCGQCTQMSCMLCNV